MQDFCLVAGTPAVCLQPTTIQYGFTQAEQKQNSEASSARRRCRPRGSSLSSRSPLARRMQPRLRRAAEPRAVARVAAALPVGEDATGVATPPHLRRTPRVRVRVGVGVRVRARVRGRGRGRGRVKVMVMVRGGGGVRAAGAVEGDEGTAHPPLGDGPHARGGSLGAMGLVRDTVRVRASSPPTPNPKPDPNPYHDGAVRVRLAIGVDGPRVVLHANRRVHEGHPLPPG